MFDSFCGQLKSLKCEFSEYKNLKNVSTIKIDTIARCLVYPNNEDELIAIINALSRNNIPFVVLGRLSNVLFRDSFYNGIVIKTDKICRKNIAENAISLQCGCRPRLVMEHLSESNKGGFEGLWGIPGSLGGMIRQNAGAFGYTISDCLIDCFVYNISDGQAYTLDKSDMKFAYRSSLLSDKKYILLSARFKPKEKSKSDIVEEVRAYAKIRKETQPTAVHSLGCIFKQASGKSAGYYIDHVGLKGYAVGGARVSDKHAGFIVNTGDATSDDVLALIEIIKFKVLREFGVELEEEIEII